MGVAIIISHIAIFAPADKLGQLADGVYIRFRQKQKLPFRRGQSLAGFDFFANAIQHHEDFGLRFTVFSLLFKLF